MNIHLASTAKVVFLSVPNQVGEVPARIWEGETDSGIKIHAYITRVAVDRDADCGQFERELQEHRAPSPAVEGIPLRLIL